MAHPAPAPHENTAHLTQPSVIRSIGLLSDVPLGELHQIAKHNIIDERAGKAVMRARLDTLAREAGHFLGTTRGPCLKNHGIALGVNPGKAGVVWSYVSSLPEHCIYQDLTFVSAWPGSVRV